MSYQHSRPGYMPRESHSRSYGSQHQDDFYDDRSRSRSRSPSRRHSSPYSGHSPPHDTSRAPRGPKHNRQPGRYPSRSPIRQTERSREPRTYYDERTSPSPPRGRNYYDRDRPGAGARRRSYSRSPHSERPSSRGKPSKEIMMEALAMHLTENDISAELKKNYHVNGLDDVRIIRDRQTKQSKQFGFLRFSTLELAQDFMDNHYPTLYLYGSGSNSSGGDSSKVKLSYSRERRDQRNDEADWTCSQCRINNFPTRLRCFRCQAPKPEEEVYVPSKASNIGDNDASPDSTPSQFLLFRGLEPSVSEELFSKGVAKLNKPTSSSNQTTLSTAKKGAKVASTTGDANLGAREGTLRRVLLVRDRQTNDNWRYGFAEYATIEDAQAALIRYNSFDRFTIASKQILVSYIHAGVFVPVLDPSVSDSFTFHPAGNPAVRLAYWDENAYISEYVLAMPEPQSSAPDVQGADPELSKKQKDSEKIKKRKAQAEAQASGIKKATPSHLQFWSNRHAELHGIQKKDTSGAGSDAGSDTGQPPSQSFADPDRNCCYLCMRQFNNSAEVNKHERLSALHRSNLKDEEKLNKAVHKLEKHGVQQSSQQAEYRDRARERRKVYGVVNKKGEQVGNKSKTVKLSLEDDKAPPVQSKGAALLSKMGYTAGQGLGASGEGMTAPISQNVYVAGVGLGAQGGKLGDAVQEAEKNTKSDYGAFAASVREQARQRYESMSKDT